MLKFTPYNRPIKASRKRVISLWQGSVDHIELTCDSDFSGEVIMAAVFALMAKVQYYVIFLTDNQNVVESWRAEPSAVPIVQTEAIESDLLKLLKARGIHLQNISIDAPQFRSLLQYLPMEYENKGYSVTSIYDEESSDEASLQTSLSEVEIDAIKTLYRLL